MSEYLGLSPSTAYRHLATLEKHGYVIRNGARYETSLKFLTIGRYTHRRVTGDPMITEKVDMFVTETGERAQFMVEENRQRVYLYTEVGQSAVQSGAHVGKRDPLHTSAAGKAIMSKLGPDPVESIVEMRSLEPPNDNHLTDRETLYEDFARSGNEATLSTVMRIQIFRVIGYRESRIINILEYEVVSKPLNPT